MSATIAVVGGVYRESNLSGSDEIFGSGGRAALAIAAMECPVDLYSYFNPLGFQVMQEHALLNGMQIHPTHIPEIVRFHYQHWLDTPVIRGKTRNDSILVQSEKVVRYGMIEGDAIVHAEYAVYDPQNPAFPIPFGENGSTAKHLAVILNLYEARLLADADLPPEELAKMIVDQNKAEVVVIKLGAQGAIAYEKGEFSYTPAFHTKHVWKIGSGDTFVAHFGYQWMHNKLSAREAIRLASLATAKYCESKYFPSPAQLARFDPKPIQPSARIKEGYKPMVYLAGPFFSLAQLWIVEQARNNFLDMGMRVFSPYHDVGRGSAEDVVQLDLDAIEECDVLFAISDGLDSGTIYEIGYARAKMKPVIMYAENVSLEDKKMMEGSSCIICDDYVTAIYKTIWAGITS